MSDLTQTIEKYLNMLPDDLRYDSPNELVALLDISLARIAELENPWIPVSERVPETAEDKQIAYLTGAYIVFDGVKVFPCEFESGYTISPWYTFTEKNVTHWMPLPNPPNESEIE